MGSFALPTPVVIAGAAPPSHAGPVGMCSRRAPVTFEEANALGRALELTEPPAPILPSVWRRRAENGKYLYRTSLEQSALDTVLSIGIILFLVWATTLTLYRRKS